MTIQENETDAQFLERMALFKPTQEGQYLRYGHPSITLVSTKSFKRLVNIAASAWLPIAEAPKKRDAEGKRPQLLLRARHPQEGWETSIVHSWWDDANWVHWRHDFPPTYFMLVHPLPDQPPTTKRESSP